MNNQQDTSPVWFGNQRVEATEKTALVLDVFNSVAHKYDLMNDLMSFGVHRLWKNSMISLCRPNASQHILDVAGGTGDIAFRLLQACGGQQLMQTKGGTITVADLTQAMLDVGQKKATAKGILHSIEWVQANAELLPFQSQKFDLYTIAFGLRNISRIDDALKQAYRVLKPGALFCCLEFSPSALPFLQRFYDLYSFHVLPRLGQLIAQDQHSYQYLVESIRKFPTPEHLLDKLNQAGFRHGQYYSLTGGIVAIHTAWRV